MATMREQFVQRFGEADAVAIERAACEHKNGIHDKMGSDPFRWALLICIGYECMSRFANYHQIATPFAEIDTWMLEHTADFAAYDGDSDFLALFGGAYDKYVGHNRNAPVGGAA